MNAAVTGWLMLIGSIALNTAGNLLIKQFSATTRMRSVLDYLSIPFILGVTAFALGVVFYGRALRDIPIVLAYPIQVGTCVLAIGVVAVAGFGEKIGASHVLGTLLIVGGVIVLSQTA